MLGPKDEVPAWNGDPTEFETYATACRWYQRSLKDADRKLVVARLWGRLQGAAKSVVRHLDPDAYDDESGLARFLSVLRSSPLQQLPVPDSFSRLDRWNTLRRRDRESISELLVREEEVFTELQQALMRARQDRSASSFIGTTPEVKQETGEDGGTDPPSTPSRSPLHPQRRRDEPDSSPGVRQTAARFVSSSPSEADFFSDELRGYRLLRACRLSPQEKQNVLVQTSNSTSFVAVRRSLRTLFAEDYDKEAIKTGKVWWHDDDWDEWDNDSYEQYWHDDSSWCDQSPGSDMSGWDNSDEWMYWQDWTEDWQDYDNSWDVTTESAPDIVPDESSTDPAEAQLREAYALAGGASKTLTEAREAVKKVRQARGYYAPESVTGKGMTSSSSSKGKGNSGYGSGKGKGFGPCFICGKPGHSYVACPDRFSAGGGKSKGKSKMKGKGKGYGKFGKSKGKSGKKGSKSSFYHDVYVNVLALEWDATVCRTRSPTRAVIDTGATENAVGIDCLNEMISDGWFAYQVCCVDLPTFRFGNGHRSQAVSRVDLRTSALGEVSFYVLGGCGSGTPPLLGARTLRSKRALISYDNGMFLLRGDHGDVNAVQMQAMESGHVTLDLAERPLMIRDFKAFAEAWLSNVDAWSLFSDSSQPHHDDVKMSSHEIYMISTSTPTSTVTTSNGMQRLAQRLEALRSQIQDGQYGIPTTFSSGRSQAQQFPVLWPTQTRQGASESTRNMGSLPDLRTSVDVCEQEWSTRRIPADGTRAWIDQPGSCRVGKAIPAHRDECRESDRQADGDQREASSDWNDVDGQHQYDVSPVLGAPEEQWCQLGATSSQPCPSGSASRASEDIDGLQVNDITGSSPGVGCRGEGHLGDEPDANRSCCSGFPVCSLERQGEVDGGPSKIVPDKGQEGARGVAQGINSRGDDNLQHRRGGQEHGSWNGLWSSLRELQDRIRTGANSELHTTTLFQNKKGTTNNTSMSDVCDADIHGDPKSTLVPPTCTTDGTFCSISSTPPSMFETFHVQSEKNKVGGGLAYRLAKSAAVLGAMVLAPVSGLLGGIQGSADFVEVACSPTSSLSTAIESMGHSIKRVNYREGYDLESRIGTSLLKQDFQQRTPRFSWISLPCTRLTPLTNLTPRSEAEWAAFEKRQQRDLKRADEVSEGVCEGLSRGMDFAWEWPTGASKGWNSKGIQRLLRKAKELGIPLFWCRFHGCAYGLEFQGVPILKQWTVLTSSRRLWLSLQKRCPGHHEHVACRGKVAQASAYYPAGMVKAASKAIVASWSEMESGQGVSLAQDVQTYLLESEVATDGHHDKVRDSVRLEDPMIMALSRKRFPAEPPTGAKLNSIRQMMLRVHRASGHSSMASLKKMLQIRGAPKWALDLAENLQCPDCLESKKPRPAPPSSTRELPALFEQVGTDVFELEFSEVREGQQSDVLKAKFVLWRDRASGLTFVDLLQRYSKSWEPTTSAVLRSFSKYLAMNPSPKWVISDPASYFTSQEWLDYFSRSGIGVLTSPAEAHWVLGGEEATIGALKATVRRLLKEMPTMDVEEAMNLAVNAHNSAIGPNGFSPFQWTRGQSMDPEFPVGLNPSKAFAGVLKLKMKAKAAYEAESARIKLSRLNNTVGRPMSSYRAGDLAMIWRQRMKPGKTSGAWVGPLRVLLQEGTTVWLATGASLVKAKLNQLRPVTKREELNASLEGTAVYRLPVTMESLLKEFTGKHFTDVTGEVPSERQKHEDLTPTEVMVPPSNRPRTDTWRVENGCLIRIHNTPRLALFVPGRLGGCPVPESRLTGKRTTLVRPLVAGGDEVIIEDDFLQDGSRNLQERWTGETKFEMSPEHPSKQRKKSIQTGVKRKGDEVNREEHDDDDDDVVIKEGIPKPSQESSSSSSAPIVVDGSVLPPVPEALVEGPLNEVLQRGVNRVDGVPDLDERVSGNQCPVPSCTLPGGHDGPHMDTSKLRFSYDPYYGRMNVGEESSTSSSSDESDELIADREMKSGDKQTMMADRIELTPRMDDQAIFALEIEVEPDDAQYFMHHPRKASIWLSKKMQEKGREAEWKKLTLEEKKLMDEAQSMELSNVLRSKALRSLTKSEMDSLNLRSVMQMRWVLTFKAGNRAKARLVVLGYQAPNLCEVQASAPTLSRLGRSMILALSARLGFKLRAGDVTSAFLQADQDMSNDNLVVWAPAELATLFGAPPEHPVMPLKIQRAFYGLVNAPRAWFDHVVGTLKKIGWEQLLSDRCVFVLRNSSGCIVALAGIHVDDFVIGGLETDEVFQAAQASLEQAYRWGKWELSSFTFAGVEIEQLKDGTVKIGQQDYTDRWMDVIELTKEREAMKKSLATPEEISALRGAIGTASWRASQTSPQFAADVGLLLSEVPFATVETLIRANKLIREMQRESAQHLTYVAGNGGISDVAIVGWADASQRNRPDGSSTLGYVIGLADSDILSGEECHVSLLSWRSAKTPRQVLGSNGAEVQAVTETEDAVFRTRGLLVEIMGISFDRKTLDHAICKYTKGAVVMDTRGIYDAASRNISSLHGLRSSRAGYELTLSVAQAVRSGTRFRWVHGGVQLGDSLTKTGARKVLLQFLANGQKWKIVHDPKFESGRKVRKRELERQIRETEISFVRQIADMAIKSRWPFDHDDQSLRIWGDAITDMPRNIDDTM